MTVSQVTPAIDYLEDGGTLSFPVPFRYLDPTDLRVSRTGADGEEVALAYGSDWSASDGDGGSGTVTLVASVSGATLHIYRVTARVQQTDYETNDTFPAETHEGALDRLTLAQQEQDAGMLRSPRAPRGEAGLPMASMADADGKVLGVVEQEIVPIDNDPAAAANHAAVAGTERYLAEQAQARGEISAANALASELRAEADAEDAAAVLAAVSIMAAVSRFGILPSTYASTVPKGVTIINVGAAGSGGTPGTYAGGVSGGPAGFTWTYTIGGGGTVTGATITNPGLATATTAPTLSFPSGGVTGAAATATVANLVGDTENYAAYSADGRDLLVYYNNAGTAAARNHSGGTQIAWPLRRRLDEAVASTHRAFAPSVVNTIDLRDPIEEVFVLCGDPDFEDNFYISKTRLEWYSGIPLARLRIYVSDYDGNEVSMVSYQQASQPGSGWLVGYQYLLAAKSFITIFVKWNAAKASFPAGVRETTYTKSEGALRPECVVSLQKQRRFLTEFEPARIVRAGSGLSFSLAKGAMLTYSGAIPSGSPVYNDYPIDNRINLHHPLLIDLVDDGHNEETTNMVMIPGSVIGGRGPHATRLYNTQVPGVGPYLASRVAEMGHSCGFVDLLLDQQAAFPYILHNDITDAQTALSAIGDPIQHRRIYQFIRRCTLRSGTTQDAWGIGMGTTSNGELLIEDVLWQQRNPATTKALLGMHNSPGQHAGHVTRLRRVTREQANPAAAQISLLGAFPQTSRNTVIVEDSPTFTSVTGALTMLNTAVGMPRRARDRWPFEVIGNVAVTVTDPGMDVLAVEAGTSISGTAGPYTDYDIFGPRYDPVTGRGEYLANDATDTGNIGNAVWGDRTGDPKTLVFARAGFAAETYDVDQDYTGLTRAQILEDINNSLTNYTISVVNIAGEIGAHS